jgi:serine/threonine protein kinase
MGEDHDLESDRESRLDHVVASYLAELGSDVKPDRQAWLVRYPEFFDELSDFFADHDSLEQIAAPLRQFADNSDDALALQGLDPPLHPEHLGRLGDYEVTDWLGQGGMGVVFKAFDETLNRHVAIKVMAPQWSADAAARRRFTREAQAAAAISHPHVVIIHAVGEWRGRSYLVMEYISGSSLEQRIRERGPLELKEILRIGSQVASGLAAAHAQGLIHRDVKPGNIMLENDLPRVKLTDFGLARAVDDVRLTRQGILVGTPQYMAPEQARGEQLDRRTDQFSLGSVLYALCTGRPAFAGESTVEVIHRVCESTPPPIQELNPDIPDWLVEIVERLLSKRPSDRFPSVGAVAELLERHLARLQDPSLPPIVHDWVEHSAPPSASRLRRLAGRRRVTLLSLVLLGAVIGLESLRFTSSTAIPEPEAAFELDQDDRGGTAAKANASGTGERAIPGNEGQRPTPLREYEARFGETLDTRHVRLQPGSAGPSSVRADAQGIWLLANPDGTPPVVELMFAVTGDFEITAAYEIPRREGAETPDSIGPSLQLFGDNGADLCAMLTRPLRAANSGVEMLCRERPDANVLGLVGPDPTRAMTGKLRMARIGPMLTFSVADAATETFREVLRREFGREVCRGIRLSAVAQGGTSPRSLVWKSAVVRAGELIEQHSAERAARVPATSAPPSEWPPLPQLDDSRLVQSYSQSFLDKTYDFRRLRISAPGGATSLVRPDPRGVRITIPAKLREPIAIETKFGIHGDFDLRATYEVLACQKPTVGFGVGPELLVKFPGDWDRLASFSRFARPGDTVYSAVTVRKTDGQTQVDGHWPATTARKGTFRLVRTGSTLHYLVAEGDGQDFRKIYQANLGTEDLEFARIAAVTGGSPSAVDVLWKDLSVRAEDLPGLPGGSPVAKRSGWWIPALGVLVLSVVGAALWLRAVASRPAGTAAKPTGAPDPDSSGDWDDATLRKLETHAAAYAESHPEAEVYIERPRFRFSMRGGVLHGPFVAWAPLDRAARRGLGTNWEEVCEKLPIRFEGAYRNGKRNGVFVYRNGSGKDVARRYRDGEPVA